MRKKWTDEEVQFLKFAFPDKNFTNKEIFEAFKDRTPAQIYAKAQKLGIKRYKEIFPYGYKRCSLCKIILPLEDFSKDKRNKDGRTSACKKCLYNYELERTGKIKKDKIPSESKIPSEDKIPSESKKCNICEQIKPLNEFHRNKNMKDGYLNMCKECKRKRYITGGY